MSVYLGQDGLIQIKRTADESGFIALVKPSDVNTDRKRFSYDYVENLGGGIGAITDTSKPDTPDNRDEMQYVPLITGDRVRFQRVERKEGKDKNGKDIIKWENSTKNQQLVKKVLPNGTTKYDTDFVAYVNVDGLGGIRLYESFEDAINFRKAAAFELQDITENHYFRITSGQLDQYRGLARVRTYEFTTNREQIDITSLGKNFRRFYSNGLLSGQGSIECLFPLSVCGDDADEGQCEDVRYLAELILRLEEGAVFSGNFVLSQDNNNKARTNQFLYYECDKCVISSVAVTVDVSQVLRANIQFVTSGPFQLRYSTLPGFILLETLGEEELLLQETDDGLELLDDDLLD